MVCQRAPVTASHHAERDAYQEEHRMIPKVYINGKYYDKPDAKISVYDHGLLYGDGVFEGIRIYSGKAFKLNEHVTRLFESARHIKLEIPLTPEQMMKAINDTIAINHKKEGY